MILFVNLCKNTTIYNFIPNYYWQKNKVPKKDFYNLFLIDQKAFCLNNRGKIGALIYADHSSF